MLPKRFMIESFIALETTFNKLQLFFLSTLYLYSPPGRLLPPVPVLPALPGPRLPDRPAEAGRHPQQQGECGHWQQGGDCHQREQGGQGGGGQPAHWTQGGYHQQSLDSAEAWTAVQCSPVQYSEAMCSVQYSPVQGRLVQAAGLPAEQPGGTGGDACLQPAGNTCLQPCLPALSGPGHSV